MQYLSRRLIATSAFRLAKQGATNALNQSVKTLCDHGIIVELTKTDVHSRFGCSARSFAVAKSEAFI